MELLEGYLILISSIVEIVERLDIRILVDPEDDGKPSLQLFLAGTKGRS